METLELTVSSASESNSAVRRSGDLLTAGAESWQLSPEEWVEQQLLRLNLASVLEARLLHIKAARLAAFDLAADPDSVNLTQLAALHRGHSGTAGQAFELAVADACNAGVSEVAEPLLEALRLIGVPAENPPRMHVLGLEKIPTEHAAGISAQLRAQLPPDGVLRDGARGRPASVETVLARLTDATWSTTQKPRGFEPQSNQLLRADALLVSGSTMVPVSMKIRATAVFANGWAGVPIWVCLEPGRPTRVYRDNSAKYPMIVVRLGQGRWSSMFYEALNLLERVIREVDLGRPWSSSAKRPWGNRIGLPIVGQLYKLRSEPIRAVVEELRQVDPRVIEYAWNDAVVSSSRHEVTVLDAADLHLKWRLEAAQGLLFMGQRHLFVPRPTSDMEGTRQPIL